MVDLFAALKVQFPKQVHYLPGNHEMAQWTGRTVLKADEDLVAGHASANPVASNVLEVMHLELVDKTAPFELIENRLRQRVAAARLRGG